MNEQAQNNLITELSRNVVIKIAPEEQPSFNAISQAYFKNPEKTLKGEGGKDELMGWGVAEVTILVTPIVLEIVKEILKDLIGVYITKNPTLFDKFANFIKRLFRINPSPPLQLLEPQTKEQLKPLSTEQLEEVRQRAYIKAIQLGLASDKATLLADSVVGSFKLTPSLLVAPYGN
ncbi:MULTISPECIES: hypothetical protein [Nostoc]|uniref:Band 7 domain-containing protein n=1 Tax=Nostoc paludosum FACHB-159 TaxID=2692908 RepID=A0ABR8K031_9NOSO|nr:MULTISPECIES: hypothetical protein [Nostoc]MBD2683128.1 hypothetical protein [Nostoc sp. FACHB-857]MBD2732844.1 hypothetical protein [Nostoc paludosum FACHB-159]